MTAWVTITIILLAAFFCSAFVVNYTLYVQQGKLVRTRVNRLEEQLYVPLTSYDEENFEHWW
jgi:hypothetical protein